MGRILGPLTRVVSVRLREEDVKSFVDFAEEGHAKSMSDAVGKCAQVGLQAFRHAEAMKDPARVAEFQDRVRDMIESERAAELVQSMDPSQLEGFAMMIRLEQEARVRQHRLGDR